METLGSSTHVPFTPMWSVLAAAGIVFYLILSVYPQEGFGFSDALATLGLVSPAVGLLGFRLCGWVLSKSGKFFGGNASATLCHGALAVGLLPLGVTLLVSLPVFILAPSDSIAGWIPMFALMQMLGTIGSAINTVQAVSGVMRVSKLHAVVSVMGMFGFIYAVFYLLQALN